MMEYDEDACFTNIEYSEDYPLEPLDRPELSSCIITSRPHVNHYYSLQNVNDALGRKNANDFLHHP